MSRLCTQVLVVLVVIGMIAPTAVGSAAAADVTLTLTVVDQAGEPTGDVDLSVSWDGGSEDVTTRTNGQALVDVPEGERVEISVSDDTYLRNAPFVIGNATGGEVEIPVSLPGTAKITVIDSTGPVTDAAVTLFGNDGFQSQRTGDSGTVTLEPVERTTYTVRVGKPGYLTNDTELAITGDVERTVRIERGAVELSFNVTDDHFDPPRPIESARVQIGDEATLSTLPTGRQGTSVPVNREYEVTITKEGYRSVSRTVAVDEAPVELNVSIQREPAVNVTAANERVVVGESTSVTVTDEYDEPIADASVSVEGSQAGTTDERGALSVEIPGADEQTIEVTVDGLSDTVTVEGIDPGTEAATATRTATVTEAATATETTTTGGGGPGFGPLVALVALLVAAVRLVRPSA